MKVSLLARSRKSICLFLLLNLVIRKLQLGPDTETYIEIELNPTEIGVEHSVLVNFQYEEDPTILLGATTVTGVGGLLEVKAAKPEEAELIPLKIPKIMQNSEVKKPIDIINSGDTVVDYQFVTMDGKLIGTEGARSECYSLVLSPFAGSLTSKTKLSVTARIKALGIGEQTLKFKFVTTNLLTPIEIPIELSINVVSGASMLNDGLRKFAISDNSFEKFLNCHGEEETRIATDSEIWKILLPVVRISNKKPSKEPMNTKALEVRSLFWFRLD